VTKSKENEEFGENFVDLFMKILVSEIIPALKNHKIPVNNDTRRAFMAGVAISQLLSVELMNQRLKD
jgi:hypothetical protein